MDNYLAIQSKKSIFEKWKKYFRKFFTKKNKSNKNANKKTDALLIYKQLVDENSIDINSIDTETLRVIETLLGEEINIINSKIMLDRTESEIIKREGEKVTCGTQERIEGEINMRKVEIHEDRG